MVLERGTLAESGLAYQRQIGDAAKPGVMFLCGYGTDMNGSKATYLAGRCAEAGVSCVRFDYRGCGASAGAFADGTIGAWRDDALRVFDALTTGPQIVVGSSMGGWIGLLLTQARAARVGGFVGIAAAPDFTEELIWAKLTDAQRAQLQTTGALSGDGHAISLRFIEEARDHLVLNKPLGMACPVRLLHGMRDAEVPWGHAVRLADHMTGGDVRVIVDKNGDHRFSGPENLDLLWTTVAALIRP